MTQSPAFWLLMAALALGLFAITGISGASRKRRRSDCGSSGTYDSGGSSNRDDSGSDGSGDGGSDGGGGGGD